MHCTKQNRTERSMPMSMSLSSESTRGQYAICRWMKIWIYKIMTHRECVRITCAMCMCATIYIYIFTKCKKQEKKKIINNEKKTANQIRYGKKNADKKILTKRCRRKYHKCQQKQISFLVADHITFCISVFFICCGCRSMVSCVCFFYVSACLSGG